MQAAAIAAGPFCATTLHVSLQGAVLALVTLVQDQQLEGWHDDLWHAGHSQLLASDTAWLLGMHLLLVLQYMLSWWLECNLLVKRCQQQNVVSSRCGSAGKPALSTRRTRA